MYEYNYLQPFQMFIHQNQNFNLKINPKMLKVTKTVKIIPIYIPIYNIFKILNNKIEGKEEEGKRGHQDTKKSIPYYSR